MPPNRRVILRRRPDGALAERDTELITEPAPTVGEGTALLRTTLLSIDPVTRLLLSRDIGVMPPVALDTPIRGFGAGVVVASKRAAFPVGARVTGFFDWADHQLLSQDAHAHVLDDGVGDDAALNVFGHTAMAAYFGMLDIGNPQRGDCVVVSGAAGAVGSVAGQLARLRGSRVIGVAGGPEKCRWLIEALGFSAAVDYRSGDLDGDLKALCPDGVNVFFDNVGGDILDTVAGHVASGGRVVLCGASSNYLADDNPIMAPPRNAAGLSARHVSTRAFNAMDYQGRFAHAANDLLAWKAAGELELPQVILQGLDQAPQALNRLFDGRSRGRLLVRVSD